MFSFLGTGIMRMVNMGLIAVLVIIAAIGVWNSIKGNWIDEGRDQVTEEVETHNEELDRKVITVNENVVRRVTDERVIIERKSQEIENEIRKQPTEPITNVTRNRLDGVREQQRDIREAS